MEFLLIIIIITVSWGTVFDLEITSWLLLDSKLSTLFFHFVFHFWFLVIVLLGSPFNSSDCPGNYFLEKLSYFLLNVWSDCVFFYISMSPLTLTFLYRHQYSFSSGKEWLFSLRYFLFLERCVHRKTKQMLLPNFSMNKFSN